jgi:hypothetical protein
VCAGGVVRLRRGCPVCCRAGRRPLGGPPETPRLVAVPGPSVGGRGAARDFFAPPQAGGTATPTAYQTGRKTAGGGSAGWVVLRPERKNGWGGAPGKTLGGGDFLINVPAKSPLFSASDLFPRQNPGYRRCLLGLPVGGGACGMGGLVRGTPGVRPLLRGRRAECLGVCVGKGLWRREEVSAPRQAARSGAGGEGPWQTSVGGK